MGILVPTPLPSLPKINRQAEEGYSMVAVQTMGQECLHSCAMMCIRCMLQHAGKQLLHHRSCSPIFHVLTSHLCGLVRTVHPRPVTSGGRFISVVLPLTCV